MFYTSGTCTERDLTVNAKVRCKFWGSGVDLRQFLISEEEEKTSNVN